MAAKLLHSLADENPDLQKQIGCMTGIFQLFDRQQILTGRRLVHKRLPAAPGNSHFTDGSFGTESSNMHQQQTASESNKGTTEKKRISTESSRASFSSSCSSSLSSLDFNKAAQSEVPSFDKITFPETPSRDPVLNQGNASPHLGRQSLDLRDVVKDSMYREARGLSVKTGTKEEAFPRAMKHRDSPRPLQLSKSVDGSSALGFNKQKVPDDIKESLRVLAKLRDIPWYVDESRELPRSSDELKNGSSLSNLKDRPRFSYDGKERNRLSFESRDTIKSTIKLKELPRLSLDSRECSMQSSNNDPQPDYLLRNLQNVRGSSNDEHPSLPQASNSQKRPSNVVAKLMGLEALPDSALTTDNHSNLMRGRPADEKDPFSKSLLTKDLSKPILIANSPRQTLKDPASPRWRNTDSVMKPISNTKFPIELAPWRHSDGNRSFQRPASRSVKTPSRAPNSRPSVYSEIEKRLKDLEFKQSGKDLRALKQIIETMQGKGFFDSKNEEQSSDLNIHREFETKCSSPGQSSRLTSQRNPQSSHIANSATRRTDLSRTYESPIVVMKPARIGEKTSIPTSSIPLVDDISGLKKLQSDGHADSKRGSHNSRRSKDQNPKSNRRDSPTSSTDKRASMRNIKLAQPSGRSRSPSKENTTGSGKSSGSVSPRPQQRKLELEKRSRPPIPPPTDSNKPRRQSNRSAMVSGSPGWKLRTKSSNTQLSDDQSSEMSNESRTLSCQGDDLFLPSDCSVFLDSKMDIDVTSVEQSSESYSSQSPSLKVLKNPTVDSMQKKLAERFSDDGSLAELAMVGPEHPSPVSVLDASMYRDDLPSPVKQIPDALKDDGTLDNNVLHCEDQWNPEDRSFLENKGYGMSAEINREKLQNIEHLVQKLRRLNSSHDETTTDYIASLCETENTNPDHRYISHILLASGLLLRDLSSGLASFQLHPSGYSINPELFFVLEQTKASSFVVKEEILHDKSSGLELEKSHRKLIFDIVNEMLTQKLSFVEASAEPLLKPDKLAKKSFSAQRLLKELCLEIEQLQAKKSPSTVEEEDDLKIILCEEVMYRSGSWKDFSVEIPGIVLDIERRIFKDLVDEIVIGGEAGVRARPGRRRQLFAK